MSIVSQNMKAENSFNLSVISFFRNFSVGSILKESNAYKEKGIPYLLSKVINHHIDPLTDEKVHHAGR